MSLHGVNAPNAVLDLLAQPEILVFRRRISAFHVCGSIGLVLGVGLGVVLTLYRNLPISVLVATVLVSVATFLVLAMVTKVVLRDEQLVYYHHEIAILCTVTLLLALLGEPVLPHLDITILGVGAFLFCGRIGCFMVGCCHGRPYRWGVRYSPEHAEVGFTSYYVGVRLLPIQLIESAWVLLTVVVGTGLVLDGASPGVALAWYVIVYDVGRFCFEFVRGDPARPYRVGFSEGQWTSVLLMAVVTAIELAGAIPAQTWHLLATTGVLAAMVIHRLFRQNFRHRLLNANHVDELAAAFERMPEPQPDGTASIEVVTTSAGLRISAGRTETTNGFLHHYTFSGSGRVLSRADALAAAELVRLLRHHDGPGDLLVGEPDVLHLLFPPRARAGKVSMS